MNGAFIFLADLARQINIPCKICFLQASSYNDQKVSSGKVKLMHNLDLRGKEVLVVEDIFDSNEMVETDTGYELEPIELEEPSYESIEIEILYGFFIFTIFVSSLCFLLKVKSLVFNGN